jgi:integrase
MHHTLSHKPVEANRVISSLSTALNCASKWGWVTKNVASGVHRNPESPRERYLTDTEIERLNGAIDAHPVRDSALAVRFLLLTGARKGETLRARWEDIDLSNGLWSKPAATTKGKRIHRTVLSNAAVALLEEIRARHPEGEFVFPGATNKPLTSFKRTWMTIRRGANLPGFRLHDLRHSHASLMARNGAGLLMIGTALGHTQPSTTKRYAHLTDEALRQTLNQVGEYASIGVATPMCKYLQNSDQIQNGYFD